MAKLGNYILATPGSAGGQWGMADYLQENKVPLLKYWRLFELVLAAIYAVSIGTAVAILHNPEWHDHLLRLFGRSWSAFVAQDVGSTGRGFLNYGLEAVIGIAAVAAMTTYVFGWEKFKKHGVEGAIIALFAFPTVALIIYGTQFAWEVAQVGYQDHRRLADNNVLLNRKLEKFDAKSQYETSFLNSFAYTNTVIAFGYLRGLAGHGQDADTCPLKITAPPENAAIRQSLTSIAGAFNCSVIPASRPEIDPDAEDEALRGAIVGAVVIHAVKDNPSADGFITSMGNTFHIRRSFDVPVNSPKNLVWIQIGTGDVWRK